MGGGAKIQKYSETKNYYIFILFYQIKKKISIYKFLKILGRILAPPSGRRPGAAAPLATPLYSVKFLNLNFFNRFTEKF